MDSTKNGLSVGSKLFQEVKDRPRCLTVKSGGWLVQEKKQFGSCGKLDPYSQALALLNVQTFAGHTDDSVRVSFHI